jgi:thioredoxin reductase
MEKEIETLAHVDGRLHDIIFKDGTSFSVKALYARPLFIQHCTIPEMLGCELNQDGYIKIDASYMTNVAGVYACGDNTTRMRSVSNAVAMGATAGAMVNREIVLENFG